ncbi:MAG: hypothetical protein E6R03_05240 [Hyphomicrobiaceae bacterium]|nr:MAG: hypothetical protein E6R03_05240 [Hyphomicrobiaceae bacterium]
MIEPRRGNLWLQRVNSKEPLEFTDLCQMVEVQMRREIGSWDWERDSVTLLDEPEVVNYGDHAWVVSDISQPLEMTCKEIEFTDNDMQTHEFHVIATADRIVFGGACNAGFLESGYLKRLPGESLQEGLQGLADDLKLYYNEGPDHTTRIIYNERM